MPWTLIACLVLLGIVLACLWFRHASGVMKARQEAVDVAARQRREVRAGAERSQAEEFAAVLERSESIYNQAAAMYTQALEHPLNWLPAIIMGYRPLDEDDSAPQK